MTFKFWIIALCLVSKPLFAKSQKLFGSFVLPHVSNELIVKYPSNWSRRQVSGHLARFGGVVLHRFQSKGAFLVKFEKSGNATELRTTAAALTLDDAVEYVEANQLISINQAPNDPKFSELYGLYNSGQSGGTAGADIGALKGWELSRGSKNVLVAVIDTGVDYSHKDLKNNYWNNPGEVGKDADGRDKRSNGIDDDNNGYVDDWRGWNFVSNNNNPMDDHSSRHGTHCAGTIGAEGNNQFGVVGVNWQVSLVGLKFIGAGGIGTIADAIKAIEYATNIGADITNNSWGGGGFSQTMYDAIKKSRDKGILFVAAAGNTSTNTDEFTHYPSSYNLDNIISVAAVDRNGELASFSNFGHRSVDIAAPGVDILSCAANNQFKLLSGTSMATPHVAGSAALIKSMYPSFDYRDIIKRIYSGVEVQTRLRPVVSSSGWLNVANSIEQDDTPPSAIERVRVDVKEQMAIELSWDPAGDDGSKGLASHYVLRYASTPISTEEDWLKATTGSFSLVGTREAPKGRLEGLRFNYQGYIAIRARDNVGNLGALGHSTPFSVEEVNLLYENLAESLDGLEVSGRWNTESVEDRPGLVLSDSPGSSSPDNSESYVKIGPVSLGDKTEEVGVSFFTKTALEKGYDFAFVEASFDSQRSWRRVDLITGYKSWHHRIKYINATSKQMYLRFRVRTDYDIRSEGWYIDDIMLVSKK